MTKAKWMIYTVLLGLTPVIGRYLIYAVSSVPAPRFSAGDVISFGLVLVITNINILEHQDVHPWKTMSIGVSVVLAILFAMLFAAMCFQEVNQNTIDLRMIKIVSVVLSGSCLLFSYAIIDRVSKVPSIKQQ
jgi:hypothetical protein